VSRPVPAMRATATRGHKDDTRPMEIFLVGVHTPDGKVHRSGVDAHQHTRTETRETTKLVNLPENGKRRSQRHCSWVIGIFQVQPDRSDPRMSMESGTDRNHRIRPRVKLFTPHP
jgi:hypothetical protein